MTSTFPLPGTREHAAAMTEGRHSGVQDALQWLTYGHLPEQLQLFSMPFYAAAVELVRTITTDSPELTTALNKLIEAKDSSVRAGIKHETGRAGSVPRPQEVVEPPVFTREREAEMDAGVEPGSGVQPDEVTLATGTGEVVWSSVPEEGRATVQAVGETVVIQEISGGTDNVSDGYHTFGELYDHRRALTAALCRAVPMDSWISRQHHPEGDPMFEGYFIVGIDLPGVGTITYHYKLKHLPDFQHVIELPHAPKWDGAPPSATVERLLAWATR